MSRERRRDKYYSYGYFLVYRRGGWIGENPLGSDGLSPYAMQEWVDRPSEPMWGPAL